jgi:ABC-type transport system involved in cytochrome c biogenesis permease component
VHGIVARDLRRSLRQKSRFFGGLAWSFMAARRHGTTPSLAQGAAYQAFVYPGIVVMAALFGAMLTAISTA